MRRKFVTNLALLLFLNILVKPFYAFGIDRTVQNVVGAGEYGLYFSLFSFSMMLNILLDMGIENFSRREIARQSDLLKTYLSNLIPLKLLLGVLFFITGCAIGFMLGWRFNEFRILIILLINQFLASFILYMRSNLGGLHLFKTDSVISVLDRLIMIVVCSLLLWGKVTNQPFRIEWFIYSQTFAYLISAVVSFLLVIQNTHTFSFRFDPRYFIPLLKRSAPYALLTLLMALYLRMDSVLLERLLPNGEEQAGIYAHSFRILDMFSNYGYLFAILLLPIFSKMIKNKESIEELTQFSFLLIIIPTLTFAISCIFYRQQIIALLYKEHIEMSSKVFGILILSLFGMCSTYIFGTLLTANGNLKQLNIMAAFGVILNLTLNIILIPKYNAMGSAIANLSTQMYAAFVQMFLATKYFHFRFNSKLIIKLVLFILLIILINRFYALLDFYWLFRYSAALFTGIILSVIIRLFNLRSFISIIRFKDIE